MKQIIKVLALGLSLMLQPVSSLAKDEPHAEKNDSGSSSSTSRQEGEKLDLRKSEDYAKDSSAFEDEAQLKSYSELFGKRSPGLCELGKNYLNSGSPRPNFRADSKLLTKWKCDADAKDADDCPSIAQKTVQLAKSSLTEGEKEKPFAIEKMAVAAWPKSTFESCAQSIQKPLPVNEYCLKPPKQSELSHPEVGANCPQGTALKDILKEFVAAKEEFMGCVQAVGDSCQMVLVKTKPAEAEGGKPPEIPKENAEKFANAKADYGQGDKAKDSSNLVKMNGGKHLGYVACIPQAGLSSWPEAERKNDVKSQCPEGTTAKVLQLFIGPDGRAYAQYPPGQKQANGQLALAPLKDDDHRGVLADLHGYLNGMANFIKTEQKKEVPPLLTNWLGKSGENYASLKESAGKFVSTTTSPGAASNQTPPQPKPNAQLAVTKTTALSGNRTVGSVVGACIACHQGQTNKALRASTVDTEAKLISKVKDNTSEVDRMADDHFDGESALGPKDREALKAFFSSAQ